MVAILHFFKCQYLRHLKRYRVEIRNLSLLLPYLLLAAILKPKKWQPSWILKNPYLSRLKSYRVEIRNLSKLLPYQLLAAIMEPWQPSWVFKKSISQPFK